MTENQQAPIGLSGGTSSQRGGGEHSPIYIKQVSSLSSGWMSYFAFGVSLISLSISLWQGYDNSQNRRLSVKPKLSFTDVTAREADRVGLFVENVGLGPAVIQKMTIALDGVEHKDWSSVKDLIAKEADDPFIEKHPHRILLKQGNAIMPSQKDGLFSTSPNNIGNWTSFENILAKRLKITITYCSMYDVCDSASSNN